MAKKEKPRPVTTTATAGLTHNPFAALRGAVDSPPQAQASAPAASREPKRSLPSPEPVHADSDARPAPAAKHGLPKALPKAQAGKSRGRLVLRRETKHRGGKAVIIVTGAGALRDFSHADIEALAKQLKQQLGCGGTVEGEGAACEIVLQGDRAAKVAELLRAQGFRVEGVTS